MKATHVTTCMEFSQCLRRFFPPASSHPTPALLDVLSDAPQDEAQVRQRSGLCIDQSRAPFLVLSLKVQGKQHAWSLSDSSMLASPRCLSVISISSDHSSPHPSGNSEPSSPAPLAHTHAKKLSCTWTMSENGASTSSTNDSSTIIVHHKCPCIQSSPPGLDPSNASASASESSSTHLGQMSNPIQMGGVLSLGSSHDNPINVDYICLWPVDFFVCERVEGFKYCAQAAVTHKGVCTAFTHFFGVEFHSSTFYDNCCIWEHPANQELDQQLARLGHCEAGKWVAFMAKAVCPLRK